MRDHKINLLQNAEGKNSKKKNPAKGKGFGYIFYSTVTDLAKFLGLSMSQFLSEATW